VPPARPVATTESCSHGSFKRTLAAIRTISTRSRRWKHALMLSGYLETEPRFLSS